MPSASTTPQEPLQMVIDDLPMVDLPEDHPEWVPGSNPGEVWH